MPASITKRPGPSRDLGFVLELQAASLHSCARVHDYMFMGDLLPATLTTFPPQTRATSYAPHLPASAARAAQCSIVLQRLSVLATFTYRST